MIKNIPDSYPSISKNKFFLSLAGILIIVFFSYFPVLTSDFVQWDDDAHVLDNLSIRSLDFEHLSDIFQNNVNSIYLPLTSLSFALEYHYFGYNPHVYHTTNLILHILVTIFVLCIGIRLRLSLIGAFVAALLFGIHPMHVESVAWITERKDVLYSFFYLAALLSYFRYLANQKQNSFSYFYIILTTIFGILSMLAKPMALSLPLILLLLDWFHKRKFSPKVIIEKIPLCIIIAALTWLTYLEHTRIPGKSVIEGILIWPWTCVFYLKQFMFPFVLLPIYRLPHPIILNNFEYFLSLAALGLILFALIYFKKYRWFIFSFAFYFLSIFFLLRFDELRDTNIVADRFMYLPSLGFCFLFGLGIERLWGGRGRHIITVFLIFLMAIFGIKTYKQSRIWKDSISLWSHQLKFHPNEAIALNALATVLREKDMYRLAEEEYRKIVNLQSQGMDLNSFSDTHRIMQSVDYIENLYKKAVKINPDYVEPYYNLAKLYKDTGRVQEAIKYYETTITIKPDYEDAYFSLGNLFRDIGDEKMAVLSYEKDIAVNPENEDIYTNVILALNEALTKNPDSLHYQWARGNIMKRLENLINSKTPRATSYFNLGFLYGEIGNLERAISAYRMVLDINPNHMNTFYNLGNIYKDSGNQKQALSMFEKAVKLNPRKVDAYLNMGIIYGLQGNIGKAMENYEKAIKIDPKNSKAYFNLASFHENNNNITQSIKFYDKALSLDMQNAEAHYNLGNIYAKLKKNNKAISEYLNAVEAKPNHVNAWINLSILSFHEGNYADAIKYCDEALLLGYDPPAGYLNSLQMYRNQ